MNTWLYLAFIFLFRQCGHACPIWSHLLLLARSRFEIDKNASCDGASSPLAFCEPPVVPLIEEGEQGVKLGKGRTNVVIELR
jgi:hypothetical protein